MRPRARPLCRYSFFARNVCSDAGASCGRPLPPRECQVCVSNWYSPPYLPPSSTARGRPPDSQDASPAQFSPSAPATDRGRAAVPTFTIRSTGVRTTSASSARGRCRTPLTVRTPYVIRRTPGLPSRSTTSVPARIESSSDRCSAYGTGSSCTSRESVIRITETVWPSRGKLCGSTEVVSSPCRVMPASATASRTVAALVRTVRSRPSAMKVTVRSVRTSRASPVRPIEEERATERYAPSARTPSWRRAPSTEPAVVHTRRCTPSRVRVTGRPWRTVISSPSSRSPTGAGVTTSWAPTAMPSSSRSSSMSSAKVCRVRCSPSTVSRTALSWATNAVVPLTRKATTRACGTRRRRLSGRAGRLRRCAARRASARPPVRGPGGAAGVSPPVGSWTGQRATSVRSSWSGGGAGTAGGVATAASPACPLPGTAR